MTGAFALAFAALFGALIGSFLNVCIHRLPRGTSIVWPASACPTCGRDLSWFENIPDRQLRVPSGPLPHAAARRFRGDIRSSKR